jgi:tetratricopeptide (TPR) repeat protein
MNLGLLFKEEEQWDDALEQFAAAVSYAPTYSDGYRERGVAENKLFHLAEDRFKLPDGEKSLRRALELNPDDFDALASLGGVLKRNGDLHGALEAYRKATDISRGHPYPLLNELVIQAYLSNRFELPATRRRYAQRAARTLDAQISGAEPYNFPWSFFDRALLYLFEGDPGAFLQTLERSLSPDCANWMAATFADTLRLLPKDFQAATVQHAIQKLQEFSH